MPPELTHQILPRHRLARMCGLMRRPGEYAATTREQSRKCSQYPPIELGEICSGRRIAAATAITMRIMSSTGSLPTGGSETGRSVGFSIAYLMPGQRPPGRTKAENTMNEAELIDVLAQKLGTDRRQAATVLETMLDTIVRAVHSGDSVTISGFGVFEQRRRGSRVARNPRTGEAVRLKPTSVPSFRPGAQFKATVASGAEPVPPEELATKPGAGGDEADEAAAPISAFAGVGAAAPAEVVTVDAVHPVQALQALVAESTEVQKAVSRPVIQKEARLTERFQQYLEGHHHEVMRYRITPTGTPTLYSDLADITANTLYEAKGAADRMSVRLALGQVLDYGRYIEGSRLAVLLPEAPAADLVELLELHDVGCVVETTPKNFVDRTTLNRCPGLK